MLGDGQLEDFVNELHLECLVGGGGCGEGGGGIHLGGEEACIKFGWANNPMHV